MIKYELIAAKGLTVIADTAPEALRELADDMEHRGGTVLAVGITYNQDEGDYTAYALYE